MEVFRLAKKNYASDLSGMGAKTYGGRWNSVGTSMLYTSSHISLAAMEIACHSGGVMGINNLELVCIKIDEKASLETWNAAKLPKNWRMFPSGVQTARLGDEWIRSFRTLLLCVPSAVVEEEYNILLNPLHPQFNKQVKISGVKPFTFDPRLFSIL